MSFTTLKEIKDAICGEDSEGKSRAISIVGAHTYNMKNTGEEPRVIAEFSSTEPIVSIVIGGDITWVSMKFISDDSNNLKLFFRTLERYLEETDKNTEEAEAVAFLTFIPLEFSGQYYMTAMHPIMWALEPESVGEDSRTLRVAFFSENVSFLETDYDDGFFDDALAMAAGNNDPDDDRFNSRQYDSTERDRAFMDSDKYIADFDDDDDEEDEDDDFEDIDDEDDDDEDENLNNGREGYIYH